MQSRRPSRAYTRSRINAAVESLECRRLLAAEITVLVSDGSSFNAAQSSQPGGSPLRIDFNTSIAGPAGSAKVKTMAIRNDGDATLTITSLHRPREGNLSWFTFQAVGGHQFPAPDTTQNEQINAAPINIAPGQTYQTRIVFPTHTPIEFVNTNNNFIEIKSNDPSESTFKFFVFGQVVKPSVDNPMFLSFAGNTIDVPDGEVRALHFLDGMPDRIIQTRDAAVFFELASRSDLTLSLDGRTLEEFNNGARLKYFLTRDTSNFNTLDLGERTSKLKEWFTPDLATNPAPVVETMNDLAAGRYILHISIHNIPSTNGSGDFAVGYDVSMTRAPKPLPAVSVSGNGAAISSGDTTPSTADSTSFGSRAQGTGLPQMTFAVRNTGPSGAPALKGTVTVNGDFEVVNGLPSAGVDRNASDDVIVRLRESRSGVGTKSGTVTIDPSEPGVPNFTFAVGGTITEAPPTFAVLSGGTLTVTGTSGNDSILMAVSAGNLVVTRNGQAMSFSASAITAGIVVNALDGNDGVSSSATVTMRQTLNGGAGNDTLRGGKGSDLLAGGDGNDYLDGGGRGDVLSGGAGPDTARYSTRTNGVVVTLDGLANDGEPGEEDNVMLDVEHLIGGSGNDRLVGNGLRNRFRGGAGNDTLIGFSREDTLMGEAGDDLLDGGNGTDVLDGGAGNNTLVN